VLSEALADGSMYHLQVYLAAASALANSAVGFAYAQAVVVAWWYRASKGATIRSLQRQWEASFSLIYAMLPSKGTSLAIRLATILVALMIVDGPLLQKASSVITATQTETVTMNLTLAPELPTGFSGYSQNEIGVTSSASMYIAQGWTDRTPITIPSPKACNGDCTGRVVGPGVTKTNCTSWTWPITEHMFFDPNATWGSNSDVFYSSTRWDVIPQHPTFYVGLRNHILGLDTDIDSTQSEAARLSVGLIRLFDNHGNYTETTCQLLPAVLEYDVNVNSAGVVSMQYGLGSSGDLVALANNTLASVVDNNQTALNTMDALTYYLAPSVIANAHATTIDPIYGWVEDGGTYNTQSMKYTDWQAVAGTLNVAYLDPTLDIIRSLNEIHFRAAVLSSTWSNLTQLIDPGLSANQCITANQTVTHNIYRADFRW